MADTEQLHAGLSPRREAPTSILASEAATSRPASVTIGLEPSEVYAFVRDFTNFPKFMRGCTKVELVATKVARLTFDQNGGPKSCDIERISEIQDSMVSWKTVGESTLEHAGAISVEAAPGKRGTVVSLRMQFDRDVRGKVAGMLSYFLGHDPKNESYINLRRLKAYLETGEVPTIQGQPSGRDQ